MKLFCLHTFTLRYTAYSSNKYTVACPTTITHFSLSTNEFDPTTYCSCWHITAFLVVRTTYAIAIAIYNESRTFPTSGGATWPIMPLVYNRGPPKFSRWGSLWIFDERLLKRINEKSLNYRDSDVARPPTFQALTKTSAMSAHISGRKNIHIRRVCVCLVTKQNTQVSPWSALRVLPWWR